MRMWGHGRIAVAKKIISEETQVELKENEDLIVSSTKIKSKKISKIESVILDLRSKSKRLAKKAPKFLESKNIIQEDNWDLSLKGSLETVNLYLEQAIATKSNVAMILGSFEENDLKEYPGGQERFGKQLCKIAEMGNKVRIIFWKKDAMKLEDVLPFSIINIVSNYHEKVNSSSKSEIEFLCSGMDPDMGISFFTLLYGHNENRLRLVNTQAALIENHKSLLYPAVDIRESEHLESTAQVMLELFELYISAIKCKALQRNIKTTRPIITIIESFFKKKKRTHSTPTIPI